MSYFKLVGIPMGRKEYNPMEYRMYTNGKKERYAVVYTTYTRYKNYKKKYLG